MKTKRFSEVIFSNADAYTVAGVLVSHEQCYHVVSWVNSRLLYIVYLVILTTVRNLLQSPESVSMMFDIPIAEYVGTFRGKGKAKAVRHEKDYHNHLQWLYGIAAYNRTCLSRLGGSCSFLQSYKAREWWRCDSSKYDRRKTVNLVEGAR